MLNVKLLCYSLCLSRLLHNGVENVVIAFSGRCNVGLLVYNLVPVFRLHVPLRCIGMRRFCFSCFRLFLWIDLVVVGIVSGRVVGSS
jgi:hypothetical protein